MKAVILLPLRLTTLLAALLLGVMPGLASAVDNIEDITEIEPTPEPAPQKRTIYFPQFQLFQTVKNEDQLIYDIKGRLEFVDECLRVVSGQQSYLLIWPGWYDFTVVGREIVVNKTTNGTSATVARLKIGDTVSFSGAELVYYPVMLQFGIPDSCLGPYWAVGDIAPVGTDSSARYYSEPTVRKTEKISKPARRVYKPIVKTEPKKYKSAKRTNKELKKLEIMLEDTMLR